MKKIFLTGSTGFIGKNIKEVLGSRYTFYTPTHQELDLLQSEDVKKYLAENKFDIVIHSAGSGVTREQSGGQDVFALNTKMFMNVAENSSLYGRLIFFGSGAEYGKQQAIVKVKELDFGKVKPEDGYGSSKYFVSEFIEKSTNIINLRLFGAFGPYEDYRTRFISNAICRSLYGLPIVLNQNVIFDYIYIKDLTKILEYFIEDKPKEKFYNVGAGEHTELLHLAKIIKQETGSELEIIVKNPGLNKEYTADNSRLLQELNDFKFTNIKISIGEMVEWYKANINMIDKNKLNFDA